MSIKTPNPNIFQRGLVPCLNCGAESPADEHEPLSVHPCAKCQSPVLFPLRIKSYWLFQPLGGGGMGAVYKAVQEGSGREFAVKVLPREGVNNPDWINALLREGQAGQDIGKNPNIVPMIEFGEESGEHFIVTEFAHGDRLDQYIEQHGHLPDKIAVDITLQLIEAEIYICENGYLFRDMKPENVMYSEETGTVKLFDFGLCIPMKQASSPHGAGDELEGSPFYLPPERVVGAAEGEYSEVYSLGMLLYYMLSGKNFYSEGDIQKIVTKHVSSLRMSSVGNRMKHCDVVLIPILDKMVARTPNARYHRLAELKEALEEAYKNLGKSSAVPDSALTGGTGSHPASPGATAQNIPPVAIDPASLRRRRMIMTGISTGIIVLIIGAIGVFVFFHFAKVKRVKQQIRKETASALGVQPDINPPKMGIAEIENLIRARSEKIFAEESHNLPEFDSKAEEKAICDELGVGTFRRQPEKTVSQLRQEIQRNIETEVENETRKIMAEFPEAEERKRLLNDIGLTEPLPDMKLSPEEVEKTFRQTIAAKVRGKYSAKELSRQTTEIMEKYRGYRIGDQVTLTDPVGLEVSGRFLGREGDKIVIGERKLLTRDIPYSELWKFSQALSAQKTARAVKQLKETFRKQQLEYQNELVKSEHEAFYREHGFVKDKKGEWRDPAELINEGLAAARKSFEARQTAKISAIRNRVKRNFDESKYIRKHGYVKIGNDWLSEKNAVDREMERRRKEFENKRSVESARLMERAEKNAREELFREHGYVFVDSKWQAASELIELAVIRDMEKRMAAE